MIFRKVISVILCIAVLFSVMPAGAATNIDERTMRTVYIHAQGENPKDTVHNSTVYIGENADIYFSVDNPNKGAYDAAADIHKEPQYDMNGYTMRLCFDPDFFDIAGNIAAPIEYSIPDDNFPDSGSKDENIGDDTGEDVPATVGYFVYKHGSGSYTYAGKVFKTAYITVFYSGGYVPQKNNNQLWYNLAKLSLIPKRTGSTDVFLDVDSGEEDYMLELFAKNNESDELADQTFTYNALNGGYHHIIIKDRTKPAPPMATPGEGTYVDRVSVKLDAEEDCIIYYTLDGTDPLTSASRQVYDDEIDIDIKTTIKACSYRTADGKYSNSVSWTYDIIPDRPYLFEEVGNTKKLLPDIYSNATAFDVYVSDKNVFGEIGEDSIVYYTFSDKEFSQANTGDNPETKWVEVSKLMPVLHIDKNRVVRLITDKVGKHSEIAVYYLSIKPAAPVASHPSGEYNEYKLDVTLTTRTQNADIFYTLDGTDPVSSPSRLEYTGIPITIAKDCTLRAVSHFDGIWSDRVSYYYLFKYPDVYGVDAFYPSGVYEGSVNVTLTPYDPSNEVMYHFGDGEWKIFDKMLILDKDTNIIAKAVKLSPDGEIIAEGSEYVFTYKIKPLPPEFAPESTQFTNADKITIFTPESNEDTYEQYELRYTTDGTDPTNSPTAQIADDKSDSAVIQISKYTIVSAVVVKNGTSFSNVVTHSYDIVMVKPVKPLTTLTPGNYTMEIGGNPYSTQFMPVPTGTTIYYTINDEGGFCPDPVPGAEGTYEYDGTSFIDVRGKTVIKAISVNALGIKSDIGIFSYLITPEPPVAAPSASISGTQLPVVPVDAVEGSTIIYTIGDFTNEFKNDDGERFYIDTHTGNAYRDPDCTEQLGSSSGVENGDRVVLEIKKELHGVESDTSTYVYAVTNDPGVLAPPYADKITGTYPERRIDDNNNLLAVRLYSLNQGGYIQYRFGNDGSWDTYTDGTDILIKGDAILQSRYVKDRNYSAMASYAYNFEPLPPVITLPSGTYLDGESRTTTITYDPMAPTDKCDMLKGPNKIYYRRNGDPKDYDYTGQVLSIPYTMSVKAYVDNGVRKSKNAINYYIIEKGSVSTGIVYVAYPYDVNRISAAVINTGDYAEGIRLYSPNTTAEIHYWYEYTKKAENPEDRTTVSTNEAIYDVNRPIIPTELMEDITIYAWLEDKDGNRIEGSDAKFPHKIDLIHLKVPVTSLEASGNIEFPNGTKYTLVNDYPGDSNILTYYTMDGSNPADEDNPSRLLYDDSQLSLEGATTVTTVYFSACGTCVACKGGDKSECWSGVYGKNGVYRYTVPSAAPSSGGGGGGSHTIDKTRKYTVDIFGNEHPTHIGYINGYPDGSVQPEGDITREEITAILYRVTNHEYEKPFVETGDVFPDVQDGRWSAHDIEYMADKEVVKGYPDGEFKPDRNLTRAEFAALIFRFTDIDIAEIENPFPDLEDNHWAYNEILALVDSGLMEGYEDGRFMAENNITRAEVMTVMNKILGRKPLDSYVKSQDFNPFNDLFEDRWYYVTVLEATITHNYWLDKAGYEYKWEDWK